MKTLLSLIVTSSLFSTPLLSLSPKQLISMYSNLHGSPFYTSISFNPDVNMDVSKGTNSWWKTLSDSDNKQYIFDYLSYAKDKDTFLKYYKTITFNTFYAHSSSSGFSHSQDYNGPVTIKLQSNDSTYTFFNWSQKGAQNQASNNATVDISWLYNKLYFNFKVYCWMYQGGNSSWTDTESKLQVSKVTMDSNWNLDTIKNNLTNALSNTINLVSDYSGSLEDKRNIIDPTGKGNDETTKINSIISSVLGNDYNDWKQYIQPYAFSDTNRTATIIFKFIDPVTQQQVVWPFSMPINITLSKDYWSKSLRERLHIMSGQIVNPQDSTKGMVPDTGIQLEPNKVTDDYGGNIQYHTTAHIEFDGLSDSSEWMTVNGKPVQVLNNKFIYDMTDERVEQGTKANNVYDIIVYHDDGIYKSQYEIKYTIDNLVPTLQEKWYAWDPQNNPDQNILIQPTIDGKANPKYDKEVNPDTGTKTQILWVKRKSNYPFPLDPLNKNGEVIDPSKNPDDYDLGFLAEGSVAGMGVQQLFSTTEVANVLREGVDNNLNEFITPDANQKLTTIIPDTDNKYWSWEGFWHYITKTPDGLAYEKYVLIGAQYQDKYPRFLDVLNNANIAVDFWTTIHGVHLKNYLATYKNLDSNDISKLNFEQVASYWKEYTSDVISQRIPPDPQPANYVDITGVLPEVKLNETDVSKIRDAVNLSVNSYIIKKCNTAKLNIDYFIYTSDGKDINVDMSGLNSLLNTQTNPQYLKLTIKAATTSTLLIGTASVQVRNSSHYDPTKADDLSKIKFDNYSYNFQDFNIDKIRNWIINNVQNYLKKYNYLNISLNVDYGISGDGIPEQDSITHHNTPGDLSDSLLQKFLDTTQGKTNLLITVYADDASDLAVGSAEFSLINDPGADPAPPDPPIPPDPTPNPKPKANQKYLAWVLPLVIGITGIGIGVYFYIRNKRKKGIGGKKRTKIKKENHYE